MKFAPPTVLTALGALFTAATLAMPAQAFDLQDMSAAERDAFRAEIRTYLLENPEVIMEAVAVLEKRQAEEQARGDSDLVKANAGALFDDGHSWVGGNPEGDITLVEFMDYRCGYCKRAFPEVESLLETDGNIRLIVKEFPILGEQSVLASRFAIATLNVAGDEGYKQVHDALMTFRGDITEPALARLAEGFGLDADAIAAEMGSEAVTEVINKNRALGQRLNITGTPSFVMEDQMLRGYVPLDAMQQIVADIRG
ncbi:protein-disulfide isomerase [Roseovarius halotolerans]|uniref:Disulfide bond formation protein D n=1 Tax=Roseovarius halotolerans TaxID=505353 RepID=A0A1X6YLK0_9RHOB|nr:DsbA family protein [Roseovarius halotolerans]RKT34366.1 protein-disulfide isomerase [Roseovarius halotolerans]SLN24398.1 Disulfide bond formation protein D precursor [Roseovarius halotolerans]